MGGLGIGMRVGHKLKGILESACDYKVLRQVMLLCNSLVVARVCLPPLYVCLAGTRFYVDLL